MSPRDRLAGLLSADLLDLIEAVVDDRVAQRLAELPPASGPQWLTLAQAAARLDCTPDAVRMRVRRGRLVSERQGSRVYVSAASVDTLRGRA